MELPRPEIEQRFIYTRFSDHVPSVRMIYERCRQELGATGNVITTLSAGWPLVFSQWGAQRCIAIERNPDQVGYLTRKYSDPEDYGDLHYFLTQRTETHVRDFIDLPADFWQGRVIGNEFVYLTNICDHAREDGRVSEFLDQVVSIASTPAEQSSITVAMTSYGNVSFDDCADYLLQQASSAGLSFFYENKNNPLNVDSSLLKNFGIFTFKN